jgi:hypothetical protein
MDAPWCRNGLADVELWLHQSEQTGARRTKILFGLTGV